MIIWDLDDTFWQGTLTEGSVVLLRQNIELVITLARRGIISSIASKNIYNDVKVILEDHGVWQYFVFPHIEFSSKGAPISRIIEHTNLRPENVLFIDDNTLNLQEARHCNPELMTAHPASILPVLLDLPQAAGKEDPGLTRLKQYQLLEQKVADFHRSSLTNEAFLRGCDVRVSIDLDVEQNIDRVIELINRSNQLNFTKSRLSSEKYCVEFREKLREYGIHSAVIRASDRYGDYGIVGFFMLQKYFGASELLHFAFSCRIMNMGIEQYVYEILGEPTCRIIAPVAYGLKPFPEVDWIAPPAGERTLEPSMDEKLLLIGGCDLLQMATYCSTNRTEYVNSERDKVIVRYDDPGLILNDRDILKKSQFLPTIPTWTYEDAVKIDSDLADAKILIVSMGDSYKSQYALIENSILLQVSNGQRSLDEYMKNREIVGPDNYKSLTLTLKEREILVTKALDRMKLLSTRAIGRFLLGVNTRGAEGVAFELRSSYNMLARDYCLRDRAFEFISVDEIVPEDELIDIWHFSRLGYFAIARAIIDRIEKAKLTTATH
jgi:FkbH-like protein